MSEKEAQRLAVNQRVVDGHASQGVAAEELGVIDGILNRSLSIGLSDPCRVGHHLVVGQRGGKDGVEHRLVQLGPELLAGLSDHAWKAALGIGQGCHK